MYTLNGLSFTDFNLIPQKAPDSDLAITGAWDMPARTGQTHFIWDEDQGLEPYLGAAELFYGGRDLIVHAIIEGSSRPDALVKVNTFYDAINAMGDLVPLSAPWGTWQVYVRDAANVEYLADGYSVIKMPFREPVVDLTGAVVLPDDGSVGIDGISFEALGLVKAKTIDQFSLPEQKSVSVTAYGSEGYKVSNRSFREFGLRFYIIQPTYSDFNSVVRNLFALFSKPGARTLGLDDNSTREIFFKDGFKVSGVRRDVSTGKFIATLDVNITEIRLLEIWNKLTDNDGLLLVDKHGQPLSEILKKL